MYVLQRNGDVFEMRHETSETVPGPVVSAPLLWAGGTTGAGRRAAWEAFIRTGEITDNSLPKPIADSWRRCRDMGVDPLMPRCAEFAPAGQVEPQAAVYAELAAQVERRAYEQVRRKGLLITVAEAHGRILRTCGSKEVLLQADNLHFAHGLKGALVGRKQPPEARAALSEAGFERLLPGLGLRIRLGRTAAQPTAQSIEDSHQLAAERTASSILMISSLMATGLSI